MSTLRTPVMVLAWLPDGMLGRLRARFPQCELLDGNEPAILEAHLASAEIPYGFPPSAISQGSPGTAPPPRQWPTCAAKRWRWWAWATSAWQWPGWHALMACASSAADARAGLLRMSIASFRWRS